MGPGAENSHEGIVGARDRLSLGDRSQRVRTFSTDEGAEMHEGHQKGLKRALLAGIFANLSVAVVKFVAYAFTNSAAMLAESVHSVADSSNQALLFLGIRRSTRPASESHPLGHSTERYFWTFVVAINIFVLGALVAIYEGVEKIRHPHPAENLAWSFGALGVAMIFEAFALRVAWKEFQHFRARSTGW